MNAKDQEADDVAQVGLRAARQVADRGSSGRWAIVVVVAEITNDDPVVVLASNVSSGNGDIAGILAEASRLAREGR